MLNEEIVEQIRKMKDEGKGISSIARELGLSRPTVLKYLSEIGTDETGETHFRKRLRNREHPSSNPGSGLLVQSMRDELEASKLELELSKIQDAQLKWEERRDRERKENAEQEENIRLKEFRLKEEQCEKEERRKRSRIVIQKIKEAVCPAKIRKVIPSNILAEVYLATETTLNKLDVLTLPQSELETICLAIRDKIFRKYGDEIWSSLSNYLYSIGREIGRELLKEKIKELYDQFLKEGYEKSFQDFCSETGAKDLF